MAGCSLQQRKELLSRYAAAACCRKCGTHPLPKVAPSVAVSLRWTTAFPHVPIVRASARPRKTNSGSRMCGSEADFGHTGEGWWSLVYPRIGQRTAALLRVRVLFVKPPLSTVPLRHHPPHPAVSVCAEHEYIFFSFSDA